MSLPICKSLQEIAELIGGHAEGQPDLPITGVAGLTEAAQGDLTFVQDIKRLQEAEESLAAAIIVPPGTPQGIKPRIIFKNPRLAFAKALEIFHPVRRMEPGIHPTAQIDPRAQLGEGVCVGPYVIVEGDARIGARCSLHAHVVVGEGVTLGEDCVLYPQVTLYPDVTLGDRVILHAGAVVGSDGFGYLKQDNRHYKIPQVGTVVIEDDVELGANCTIDRSTTGVTRIGRGTKIDNLSHIAHNVQIGEDCAIAALAGISGSVSIGARTILAGQVGVADHVSIGSDSIVAGRSGVTGKHPDGSFISGFPARPHREEMRLQASLRQIPKLLETIKELKRKVDELEKRDSR